MLIAGIMGQDSITTLSMCLESVKAADRIVYIDGGSVDGSRRLARHYGAEVIVNVYDQNDKEMNGKQRNKFLSYLKKNYPKAWCVFLDADEVLSDNGIMEIKKFLKSREKGIYSIRMRHLIDNLGHEDSSKDVHVVLNRLFYVGSAKSYPLQEHPVLQGDIKQFACAGATVWHLAYVNGVEKVKKRYNNHLEKSKIHTKDYLRTWYLSHLSGSYPTKKIDMVELPTPLLKHYGIEKDELYFSSRHIENKHWIDILQWKDYFKLDRGLE